jgi:phosphatidate cytidylyltransferase
VLGQRVAAASVAIPIIFGLIWLGGWAYALAAAAILAVAAAEFVHFKSPWLSVSTIVAAAYTALLAVSAPLIGGYAILLLGGALAVSALPAAYLWIRRGSACAEHAIWLVMGVLYVGALGSTLVLLRELDRGLIIGTIRYLNDGSAVVTTRDTGNGRDWVYLALFSTFAGDTAAYFTGRAIGRHKLAPAISPKKTWEGFLGGCAGGFAAVLLLNYVLGLRVDVRPALLIAATLPLAGAAGDLFESWVKRRAGVKDASDLIPGHGGLLDRLDSVLFTFPLVYVVARWVA